MVENHVEKVENYPLQTTSTLYSPQLYLHSTKSRGKKQVRSQKNSFGQRIFTFAGRVGNGGEGTPPSPLPRHGRATRQTTAEPQEARPLSAWQPHRAGVACFFRPGAVWPTPPGPPDGRGRRPGQNKKSSASAAKLFWLFSSVPSAPGRRAFTFSGRAFHGKRRCADSSGCF